MTSLLALVLLPALLAAVQADFPLDETFVTNTWRNDEDETIYRLPESLDPSHVTVEITPYFEATATRDAFSFDGTVTLVVTAQDDDITELTLHDNVREILGVTVSSQTGAVLALNETVPFERQRTYQFLKIYLRDGVTLVRGETYVIRVVYLGHMNETPLSRGVFRGSYIGSDGIRHWYAATHLQPTHSRQAFPSFDEPGFKAVFNIIINRPENFTGTYSNMPVATVSAPVNGRVREVFLPTPRMSAYLVTFHISEEFAVIADNNDSVRSYRILARPNAAGQGEYALEVGPPLTAWLDNYFGIPYYSMAESIKNDQIASPDWASGATENWGLVTYRESRLLYEEGETNALDKMYIGTITAHELAHKWFGNLITCRWWDNVWINEGYASYFEYFAMDGVDPSMELEDQFVIMYIQSALASDSGVSARPLQHTVNTPEQVTGHFTDISYSKGASLLNMIKHFITEETFRKGLNYFLTEMAYEHAFPEDVFRNFDIAAAEDNSLAIYPGINITDFLTVWVNDPGYPVLNVDVNTETGIMTLTQERFFLSASASPVDQIWPLPLTYTTESNPNWENTRPNFVMTGQSGQIVKESNEDWVVFNIKNIGLYRVNYDTLTWERIATALKNNVNSIHYLNRAQIVNDVFALARSERISYDLTFRVLDFLKQDTSYYSWYPAITGFSWLRNRFTHLPGTLAQFDRILFQFLDAAISAVGYDVVEGEALTRTLHRFFLLSFACNIGHDGCVRDAIVKFDDLYNRQISVNPNLRRHVFCQGLLNGGYPEWQFLYQRRLSSNNQGDEVAMLRALGCTTNQQAINEFLEMVLSEIVRAQDRVNGFVFLFMGDRGNARAALPFFRERYDDIRDAVIGSSRFASVLANMAAYMDEDGLVEMEEWLTANQAEIPEASAGLSGIASARASMAWGSEKAAEILEAARGSGAILLPATMLVMTSLVTMMLR